MKTYRKYKHNVVFISKYSCIHLTCLNMRYSAQMNESTSKSCIWPTLTIEILSFCHFSPISAGQIEFLPFLPYFCRRQGRNTFLPGRLPTLPHTHRMFFSSEFISSSMLLPSLSPIHIINTRCLTANFAACTNIKKTDHRERE